MCESVGKDRITNKAPASEGLGHSGVPARGGVAFRSTGIEDDERVVCKQ